MTTPRLIARLAATEAQAPDAAGRWTLNSGAVVTTVILGLNGDRPIRLVVDLSTLTWPARLVALAEHSPDIFSVIGSWAELAAGGDGLSAVPEWLPVDAPMGYTATIVVSMLRNRVPLRASIGFQTTGAEGSVFERLTAPASVNGREVNPAMEPLPLYVGRNLELFEASVVLFAADPKTGAIGTFHRTPHPTTPEPPMLTAEALKGILKDHPNHKALCAELQADGHDEATIRAKLRQAEGEAQAAALKAAIDEAAALKAELAAKDTEIATLKAQLAKLPGGKPAAVPAAGHQSEGDAPTTLMAALARHGDELKGKPYAARVAHVRALYPAIP